MADQLTVPGNGSRSSSDSVRSMIRLLLALCSVCLAICMPGCTKSIDEEMTVGVAPTPSEEKPSPSVAVLENSPVKSKTIVYRGGIASFSIPDSWVEEYEPTGGATFYEDSEDSGTLRLNVLAFESEDSSETMIDNLIRNQGYERLHADFAILRETKSAIESDETLDNYSWNVAVPVPPKAIRIAVFSYTILQSQSSASFFKREIELLNHNIRKADYSKDAGVAGEFAPE